MQSNLRKRAADLERQVEKYAQIVKRVLKEYRETVRTSGAKKRSSARTRSSALVLKKRNEVVRANAEYMELRKELDQVRTRLRRER